MGRFSNQGKNCLQYPFYHQHLGECTSFKHLGGLQRIGFCRRHQHSCRGRRGAGFARHHGLVLQVWCCRHQYINTPWSCTGLVLVLVWYCRHHYINTSWSGIAAFAMVFSMRRTGTAATGDLDLPNIIWFRFIFQRGESKSVPVSPDLYFQWKMKSNFTLGWVWRCSN